MRRGLGMLVCCLAFGGVSGGAVDGAAAVAPAFSDGHGITVVSATRSDARTWRLVVTTRELARPVRVNLLLRPGT